MVANDNIKEAGFYAFVAYGLSSLLMYLCSVLTIAGAGIAIAYPAHNKNMWIFSSLLLSAALAYRFWWDTKELLRDASLSSLYCCRTQETLSGFAILLGCAALVRPVDLLRGWMYIGDGVYMRVEVLVVLLIFAGVVGLFWGAIRWLDG